MRSSVPNVLSPIEKAQILAASLERMREIERRDGWQGVKKEIFRQCREVYEMAKIEHNEGRMTFERLEQVRKQVELIEGEHGQG